MTAQRTSELLLHWWNFAAVQPGDRLIEVAVEHPAGPVSPVVDADALEFVAHVQRPAEASLVELREGLKALPSPPGELVLSSLLDEWLRESFTEEDFADFRSELENPTEIITLSTEAGRLLRGSLPVLCSARLAGLFLRRPNPLFYLPSIPSVDSDADHVAVSFDMHWLLPTPEAIEARRLLISAKPTIHVTPGEVFAVSRYLPELAGFLESGESHVLKSQPVGSKGGTEGYKLPAGVSRPTVSGRWDPVDLPLVRWCALALVATVKKVFSGRARFGSWQHELIARLTGPVSSQRVIGATQWSVLRKVNDAAKSQRGKK